MLLECGGGLNQGAKSTLTNALHQSHFWQICPTLIQLRLDLILSPLAHVANSVYNFYSLCNYKQLQIMRLDIVFVHGLNRIIPLNKCNSQVQAKLNLNTLFVYLHKANCSTFLNQ